LEWSLFFLNKKLPAFCYAARTAAGSCRVQHRPPQSQLQESNTSSKTLLVEQHISLYFLPHELKIGSKPLGGTGELNFFVVVAFCVFFSCVVLLFCFLLFL